MHIKPSANVRHVPVALFTAKLDGVARRSTVTLLLPAGTLAEASVRGSHGRT
jgi:hypothetical protein